MRPDPSAFSVTAFLDRQPFGRVQRTVLGFGAIVSVVDAYDVYVIAFVLVPMARALGVSPAALTPMLVAQQVGLLLGTYIVAPIADRVGRRPIVLLSVASFAVLTLLLTQAHTLMEIRALRFLAGVFFGSALTTVIVLMNEVSPRARRATTVTIITAGGSLAFLIGALISTPLVQRYGWQSAFVVGGIVPLALLPFLWVSLPESVRFLTSKGAGGSRIAPLLRRFDPSIVLPETDRFVLDDGIGTGPRVALLFHDGRAMQTLRIWALFLITGVGVVSLGQFLPAVLQSNGFPMSAAAATAALYALGGLALTPLCGFLVDRLGARTMLMSVFGAAGIVLIAAAVVSARLSGALLLAMFFAGTIPAAQGIMAAFASAYYPTGMRATGLGWGVGAFRFGGIIAPIAGGAVLARHWTVQHVFAGVAALMVIALVLAYSLSRSRNEAVRVSQGTVVT